MAAETLEQFIQLISLSSLHEETSNQSNDSNRPTIAALQPLSVSNFIYLITFSYCYGLIIPISQCFINFYLYCNFKSLDTKQIYIYFTFAGGECFDPHVPVFSDERIV